MCGDALTGDDCMAAVRCVRGWGERGGGVYELDEQGVQPGESAVCEPCEGSGGW